MSGEAQDYPKTLQMYRRLC